MRIMNANTVVTAEALNNELVVNEAIRQAAEAARSVYEDYNATHAYVKGNKVVSDGISYVAKQSTTGNAPPNTTYWLTISGTGDMARTVYDTALRGLDIFNYVDAGMTQANITYYVATTGSDSNNGLTSGTAFLTINKAISMIPRRLDHDVNIYVLSGTYAEDVLVHGFYGKGTLTLIGDTVSSTTRTVNSIDVRFNTCYVIVQGFNAIVTSGVKIFVSRNNYVLVIACNCTTSSSSYGIQIEYGLGRVDTCTISNQAQAVRVSNLGDAYCVNNTGTGNTISYVGAYGGMITYSGTTPAGTTIEGTGSNGGFWNKLIEIADKAPLASPTFTGVPVTSPNASYTTPQLRNTIISTGDATGGGNGDIWIKYTV